MGSFQCEGNACASVSIAWEAEVGLYRAQNHSPAPVRLSFRSWPANTEITIEGHAGAYLKFKTFEQPFLAVFAGDQPGRLRVAK